MRKNSFLKFTATAAAFSLLVNQTYLQVHAIEPDAEINTENILELLDEYDPDGAYIIRYDLSQNQSTTMFWFTGAKRITDSVATAVHEDTHGYSFHSAPFYTENIYIGNENAITVYYGKTYPSSEMAKEIPEELRTFRYDTYVGEESGDIDSNVKGIYGLLNEFTAYCWDMNNTICLYDYYQTHMNTPSDWRNYVTLIGNARMAYSEFNYYILNYVKYSKEHYPDVYSSIMSNEELLEAYTFIENKFSQLFEISEVYMKEISRHMNTGLYMNFYEKDYSKLILETEKEEYQNIYKELTEIRSGPEDTDPEPDTPETPDITEFAGDTNSDGKINASDILNLKKYLSAEITSIENADMNNDGIINIFDLARLKRIIIC